MTDCSGLVKFFETDYEATHTTQRWKLELFRFDFTVAHRPGRMLTDCDMLSRHNTWTNEWRKEEASNKWTNEQQRTKNDHVRNGGQMSNSTAPVALLALISTDGTRDPKATPSPIPRTHVNPKIVGANTVNRTLLASTCDRARAMWILGNGAETATTAMTNLGLEALPIRGTNEEKHWQSANDVPNLKMFISRIARRQAALEETPEWIVAPLTQSFFLSIKQRDIFKTAITAGKALNSKAATCMWTTVDKQTKKQQASQISEWMTELGWKATTGQIRNEQQDGHLEGRSTFLIAANRRMINRLPELFQELNDGCHYLEQIMDLGNGIMTDCFSFFAPAIDEDSKPSGSGANTKTKLDVRDGTTAETERLYCQQINSEEEEDPRRHFTDSKACFAVAGQRNC
jgi:hypothetical protein